MDETPTVKQFTYFGLTSDGGFVHLFGIFYGAASGQPQEPPQAMLDQMHSLLVQQQGLGVPRPTHYSVTELHGLPALPAAQPETKPLLMVAKNGHV
jgi:hypothetical protein